MLRENDYKKGLRIILIEDQEDQRIIWSKILESVTEVYRSFWYEVFSDPKKALESIEKHNKVAAIICDLNLGLGNPNGLNVYKSVKYGLGKTIPFMLISGDQELLDDIKIPGVHKALKPVEISKGFDLISGMIEEKLDDIRWSKLESSLEDITKMLKDHVKDEESQPLYILNKFIKGKLKKIFGGGCKK